MPLTIEQVQHIAGLARLKLTQAELERYREQLSAILDYAARLQAVDTSSIPPTASALPGREGESPTRLREDRPRPGLTREELLRTAPQAEGGMFRVPPVLE
jgi:aspartyl-tRNA(Asn)/glutamyl-tRNA(Gln) amidotransferase subunit C